MVGVEGCGTTFGHIHGNHDGLKGFQLLFTYEPMRLGYSGPPTIEPPGPGK